tara:strand:+ start:187 stop:309 length:123 start_codon:yes stop_codon:yes gene_type:complete
MIRQIIEEKNNKGTSVEIINEENVTPGIKMNNKPPKKDFL